MDIDVARRYALSLPEVSEEPHHHFSSFRVRDKIIATVPPEESHLHVFVGDEDRDRMIALDPKTYEPLRWGKKIMGLKILLAGAKAVDAKELLRLAWKRKAPKSLRNVKLPVR